MTLRLSMLSLLAVLLGSGAAPLPAADLAAQQGVWQGPFVATMRMAFWWPRCRRK